MTNITKKLEEYARLTVRQGVNVAEGQYVCVTCPVIAAEFGRMVMTEAYNAGAKEVIMLYRDEKASKIKYQRSPMDVFENVPQWAAEQRNYYARAGAAMINIIAEDPDAYAGVDSEKLMMSARVSHKAFKEYYDCIDRGDVRWTIVAYPCAEWAERMFPQLSSAKAVEKLWSCIFETVRIGRGDTVKKWKRHDKVLKARAKLLNTADFSSLECRNSLGTDITVGLAQRHIWKGGSDCSSDGRSYFPNMPTEEIFTMPDMNRTDGIVYSALPLSYQGNIIEKFWLKFENGAVSDFNAETGYDALSRLLNTDEGSRRLGEIALIPYNSPISEQGILYYNTLFDENASCHLALGDSYPDTTDGGERMTEEEVALRGGNHSANHVDFMFGTSDMNITGIKSDGTRIPILENGEFVI